MLGDIISTRRNEAGCPMSDEDRAAWWWLFKVYAGDFDKAYDAMMKFDSAAQTSFFCEQGV